LNEAVERVFIFQLRMQDARIVLGPQWRKAVPARLAREDVGKVQGALHQRQAAGPSQVVPRYDGEGGRKLSAVQKEANAPLE
jgi:hypothetical protein